jgi:hypothetical protein
MIPSIDAFMALLISDFTSIVKETWRRIEIHNDDKADDERFLDHFREYICSDIATELLIRIRDHIAMVAAKIVSKSEEKMATGSEDSIQENAGEQEYQWLFYQLRAFMTSYSLLSAFLEDQLFYEVMERDGDEDEIDKNTSKVSWPLVCIHLICSCSLIGFFVLFYVLTL